MSFSWCDSVYDMSCWRSPFPSFTDHRGSQRQRSLLSGSRTGAAPWAPERWRRTGVLPSTRVCCSWDRAERTVTATQQLDSSGPTGQKPVLRRDRVQGMDCRGAFFLCLCFMTSQSETMDTSQEPLRCMKKLETISKGRRLASLPDNIRELENSLLNASFRGNNLTLQTRSIQSLIFKLGCGFAGLSLNSTTMEQYSQAGVSHAMHFPAELTKDTCRARPRELRLICIYFSTAYFFQNANSLVLNNCVLGAQLGQGHVSNLNEPISISFQHNQSLQLSQAPVPRELLVPLIYISLVGCSISIVSSILTVLLHFQARKQGDSMTRIHMNLHASVLLLNVAFLLSPLPATPPVPGSACTAVAAILHFALLSCLTWTAIEGFNLYLLLGRVYNIYIRRYLLKLCAVGWGVPALLVLLLVVESSAYGPCTIPVSGSQENGTGFQNMSMCWVQNRWVHSILVMGYGGLTSLFNLVVLVWALRVLQRLRAQDRALNLRACRDSVTVLGLTVLLGTTWALAFFSFDVFLLPQLFLFTTFNSLYGFFLFLWFCSQRRHSEAEMETEMEGFSSSQTML
ncbi:adhesion G-protein coupled receptor G5 isoform X2 [Enhydra lutris kenyoni]|uniref:Adhesion G-protein coupled receptor G5 isoform X2 n=1 Tax=Enhydra lutris kenyoni TaxID=391180 RepID=A0A2Y9KZ64_ENHLU|nr:adhesion G-protein coupled receptor G5 isoform X2 [Enhydra lutris kenyoni]